MAKGSKLTVDVQLHGIPYLYAPSTTEINYRDPYRRALYDLENSMSPAIFEFDPTRLSGDAKPCSCDRCRGVKK
jgi:hypothetical protein